MSVRFMLLHFQRQGKASHRKRCQHIGMLIKHTNLCSASKLQSEMSVPTLDAAAGRHAAQALEVVAAGRSDIGRGRY
jgi:hypothetical protein